MSSIFDGGSSMKKNEKDIFEVFFRSKPAMMLVALRSGTKHKYGSVLAKEVDCTYSHAVKILQEMENASLVEFEKNGRIKTIRLTDSGHQVAEHIERIREIL
tara:strand:- start:1718 stop:2023 length:306 start_codon:yes stop_codon:yes gene_type:complete